MKVVVLLITSLLLIGCGDPTPVPEEAVKACLGRGWATDYFSNSGIVRFACKPIKESL